MSQKKSFFAKLHQYCNSNSGVVLFDLDGTLLDGDLGETVFLYTLMREALRERGYREVNKYTKIISDGKLLYEEINETQQWNTICHYLDLLKNKKFIEAYTLTARYLEGFSYDEILSRCKEVLKEFSQHTIIRTSDFSLELFSRANAEMLTLMRSCIEKMHQVYIVSASPQAVVEAFCEIFDFPQVHPIGAHSSQTIIPYADGKRHTIISHGINSVFMAFGNSEGDREMLEFADHSVLLNCNDLRFLNFAQRKGWHVLRQH